MALSISTVILHFQSIPFPLYCSFPLIYLSSSPSIYLLFPPSVLFLCLLIQLGVTLPLTLVHTLLTALLGQSTRQTSTLA